MNAVRGLGTASTGRARVSDCRPRSRSPRSGSARQWPGTSAAVATVGPRGATSGHVGIPRPAAGNAIIVDIGTSSHWEALCLECTGRAASGAAIPLWYLACPTRGFLQEELLQENNDVRFRLRVYGYSGDAGTHGTRPGDRAEWVWHGIPSPNGLFADDAAGDRGTYWRPNS